MSNPIQIELVGSATVFKFNRPESRNPLSTAVIETVDRAIDELRSDCDRLIFTGSDGIFASGADLREIAVLSHEDSRRFAEMGQRLMSKVSDLAVETIAAVNGACYGGAFDLALACDRRIAVEDAVFCHPGANLGIMTGWGGTQRLPRLIGEGKALELFFTAVPINAREALRIGLIEAIYSGDLNELDP